MLNHQTEQPSPATDSPPAETPKLRPRRTLNRLALAVAALLIGLTGQYFFLEDSFWDGLLFYLIAVILFIRAVGHQLERHVTVPTYDLGLATGWRRNISPWLIVVGAATFFLAYRMFADVSTAHQAWWIYLSSLLLLISGGLLLTNSNAPIAELKRLIPDRRIAGGLLLILLLALFMRLFNFGEQPFGIWYDEAQAGLEARRMLDNPDYRPLFYSPINISGHLLTLYALALNSLGDTIYSMRLVSVAFGFGGVIAAYLLGRELRGPRFGLALAFLLAIMRWHVNFSRIAMTGIDTPFFELLSLFFGVRLLRRGRLRDAMWLGLTLGFGLTFYTAFRLYLMVLIGFIFLAALWWTPKVVSSWQHRGWQIYLVNLLMIALSLAFVIMPLIRFAQDNPEEFWYRVRQTSILTKRDQADLRRAIWDTSQKHLLMFNFHGDNNGRHNLPGAPMLDPLMGVLFVFGLGLAIRRFNQPANLFFLLLFPGAMAGGILSVDFEAPQSLRSIGVIPAVIYFCGLSVVALGREAETVLQPLPPAWVRVPATLAALFIVYYNASMYFVTQANDFASWNAFSTPETLTGRKMAELGPDYLFYSSPFLTNHPTTHFLAPQVVEQYRLTLPDALPIREPPGRPVGLFIHPDDVWIYQTAQRYYPSAQFEPFARQDGTGPAVVYFVNLQPADLAMIQGLELRYAPDPSDSSPAATMAEMSLIPPPRRSLNLLATWPDDLPSNLADNPEQRFVAEWRGVLYVSHYGPHSFRLVTPGAGTLEIDGNIILEGQGEQLTGLPLAQGNHALRVRADVVPGQVKLMWQPPFQAEELIPQWSLYMPPVSNHGLLGNYYGNENWQGRPVLQRIDPFLDLYFHITPLQRPYSVEWTGSLIAPQSGLYRLGLRAVPEAELYLDGQWLITTIAPDQPTEAPVTLAAGLHDLVIRFKDNVDRSRIHFTWATPTGELMPVPSENLWPPLGDYPPPGSQSTGQPDSSLAVPTQPLNLDWLTSIGGPGSEPGQFLEPRDVARLSNGNLVVADTLNKRVQLLDPQGNPLTVMTGEPYPFEEPLAVVVNRRDEIFVLESTLQWVYRYTAEGQFVDRFAGPEARLFHPRGLTIFEDDSFAIADTGGARFVLFTPDGTLAGSIGGLGQGPGQFNEPTDLLRDQVGTYFVAEAENNRIQRVDATGSPLGQWAIPPALALDGPHLAFGPDGSIFVTESQSSSLLRYAPDGNLLAVWPVIGPVSLLKPVGIYFDDTQHQLYVTDVGSHQVHVFTVKEP